MYYNFSLNSYEFNDVFPINLIKDINQLYCFTILTNIQFNCILVKMATVDTKDSALIIIDMQNDFVLPTGSLYINGAPEIVEPISKLLADPKFKLRVFSQDWHPWEHVSFKDQGGLFAPHCIQNTPGAEIVDELRKYNNLAQTGIKKGYTYQPDSYSVFMSMDKKVSTGLNEILRTENINTLFICGVATDYCVYYSVLDALRLGYKVYLILNLTRPIGDPQPQIADMIRSGAIIINYPFN